MIVLFALLIVAVVALVGAVAVGWGGSMPEPTSDGKPFGLPETPLQAADLDGLRFAVVARGYRMDQVDSVLDRISADLTDRDAHLDPAGSTGSDGFAAAASSDPPTAEIQPIAPVEELPPVPAADTGAASAGDHGGASALRSGSEASEWPS